jgi:hypothetical protein
MQQHKRAMLLAEFDYIDGFRQEEGIIDKRIEEVNNNWRSIDNEDNMVRMRTKPATRTKMPSKGVPLSIKSN